MKEESPFVWIEVTCDFCLYLEKKSPWIASRCAHAGECVHPDRKGGGEIYTDDKDYPSYMTPRWCPLLKAAVAKAVKEYLER